MNVGNMTYKQNRYDMLNIEYETETGDKLILRMDRFKETKTDISKGETIYSYYESSFEFDLKSTNGLSKEDIKEINDFLKKDANKYIDEFVNEKLNNNDRNKINNILNEIENKLLNSKEKTQEVLTKQLKDLTKIKIENKSNDLPNDFNMFDSLKELIEESMKDLDTLFKNKETNNTIYDKNNEMLKKLNIVI
jgi:hypothetical protein